MTACEHFATASYEQIVTERCRKLGEWIQAVRRLKGDETRIRNKLPEARRRILDSKRISFMRYVIETESYDDRSLADDLESGFDLVGDTPKSSVLPVKLVPATISQQDLCEHASKTNRALQYMTRSCGDESLDKQLGDKTVSEVDKGWMVGLLQWDDLPNDSSVSRRFPLEQSGKVRPIDDLSQSQVNATVSTYEQAMVDGPDVVCNFAIYLMKCLFSAGKSTNLEGRSLDLASAYRQLAISDSSLRHACLSVYDPSRGQSVLFQQIVLPLGLHTAVNAFIRCARFLQWVAARCLSRPLSCYFDHFVAFFASCFEQQYPDHPLPDVGSLGWKFDKEGPKSDDFSGSVAALELCLIFL